MDLLMYVVLDKKTAIYQPPHFCHNDADAIRHFSAIMQEKNMVSMYPDDFCLYCVGSFNDRDSSKNSFNLPKFVIEFRTLSDILNKTEVKELSDAKTRESKSPVSSKPNQQSRAISQK